MLCVLAWAFLLRAASEATDVRRARDATPLRDPSAPLGPSSLIGLVGDTLVLRLARRKNRPHGDTLRRSCTCPGAIGASGPPGPSSHCGALVCPAHVLWPHIARRVREGDLLFGAHDIPRHAVTWARAHLAQAGLPGATTVTLHDFRRGAAQQLYARECRLSVILKAGSWTSRAFLAYLDKPGIESDLVSCALAGIASDE